MNRSATLTQDADQIKLGLKILEPSQTANEHNSEFAQNKELSVDLDNEQKSVGSHSNSLTSLLAASDGEDEEEEQVLASPTKQIQTRDAQIYGGKKNNSITKLQEEICYAVESINTHYFVDLGGVFYYDINFVGRSGFPLQIAATKGSEKFVRLMLENKMIDINKQDEDGLNAFFIAAKHGHGEVMRVLAEHGVEIYNTDRDGNNVLHMCAGFEERYNILEMLVKSRFDLNLRNVNGDTAVHIAAQRGNSRQLLCLLEHSAEINILNTHSLSALYLAVLNNKVECVSLLLEYGAKVFYAGSDLEMDRSPCYLAVRIQNVDIIRVMWSHLEIEERLKFKTSQGLTPLMFAAQNRYHTSLKALLEQKMTSDLINKEDNNGMTILLHVLEAEPFDRKLAQRLINEFGADVNHVDKHANSLISKLVQLKKTHLVDFIMRQPGVLLHVPNLEGKDACFFAKANGLALEMRSFLNCSKRLRDEDLQRLHHLRQDQYESSNNELNSSKPPLVTVHVLSSSMIDNASSIKVEDGTRSQESNTNRELLHALTKRKGTLKQAAVPEKSGGVQQILVTETIEETMDAKVQEEMRQQILQIEQRQAAAINEMIKQMKDQSQKREAQLQKMIREKDEHLARLRHKEKETDPKQLMTNFRKILTQERAKANVEMRELLNSYRDQSDATAARLATLSPEYRAELEEQKQLAKDHFGAAQKEAEGREEAKVDGRALLLTAVSPQTFGSDHGEQLPVIGSENNVRDNQSARHHS